MPVKFLQNFELSLERIRAALNTHLTLLIRIVFPLAGARQRIPPPNASEARAKRPLRPALTDTQLTGEKNSTSDVAALLAAGPAGRRAHRLSDTWERGHARQ